MCRRTWAFFAASGVPVESFFWSPKIGSPGKFSFVFRCVPHFFFFFVQAKTSLLGKIPVAPSWRWKKFQLPPYFFWSGKNVLPGENSCRPLLAGKVSNSLLVAGRIEQIYFPSSSLTALLSLLEVNRLFYCSSRVQLLISWFWLIHPQEELWLDDPGGWVSAESGVPRSPDRPGNCHAWERGRTLRIQLIVARKGTEKDTAKNAVDVTSVGQRKNAFESLPLVSVCHYGRVTQWKSR